MPPTRAERLAMLGKPLSYPEHNFAQSRADWEVAVFDNAEHFLVLDMRAPINSPERRNKYLTFPEALADACNRPGVCIYAVTATERSTILAREAWNVWEERWKQRE